MLNSPGAFVMAAALEAAKIAQYGRERLDAFRNTMTGAGGSNDKTQAVSVELPKVLTYAELQRMDMDNGYVHRLTTVASGGVLRAGHEVRYAAPDGTTDGFDTPFRSVSVLQRERKRLNVDRCFKEALHFQDLYGAGYVYVDAAPNIDLEMPLEQGPILSINYLRAFDANECSPFLWDAAGEPELYRVSPSRNGIGIPNPQGDPFRGGMRIVHRSRLIRFVGPKAPHGPMHWAEGVSLIQQIFQAIVNVTSVDQAAAILAHEFKIDVLTTDLAAIGTGPDGESNLSKRAVALSTTRSIFGSLILGKDEKYEVSTMTVSGFKDLSETARLALAAQTGLPQTVLFGESASTGATGGSDTRDALNDYLRGRWLDDVAANYERFYALCRAAVLGPFRGLAPIGEWTVVPGDFRSYSQIELANLRVTTSQADQTYVGIGLPAEYVLANRFGRRGFQLELPPISQEQLQGGIAKAEQKAAQEAAAKAQMAPGGGPPSSLTKPGGTPSVPDEGGAALGMGGRSDLVESEQKHEGPSNAPGQKNDLSHDSRAGA